MAMAKKKNVGASVGAVARKAGSNAAKAVSKATKTTVKAATGNKAKTSGELYKAKVAYDRKPRNESVISGHNIAETQEKYLKNADRKVAQAPKARERAATAKGKETTFMKDKRLFGTPAAEYLRDNPAKAKSERLSMAQVDVITHNASRQQKAAKASKQTGPVKEKGAIKRRTK